MYIVTEAVTPLRQYLTQNKLADFQLAWGLYQVAKAVWFLNNSGQLVHNAVSIWNVFVTKSGDWKLAGLDFASPVNGEFVCPKNLLPALERYWPPINQRNVDKWVVDSFGLGCLIWEVFNCPDTYDKPQCLKDVSRIPKNVQGQYQELISTQPSQRPNAQSFIDSCRGSKGAFLESQFFHNMLFIEEIQLKDNMERLRFLEKLPNQLEQFPEDVRRYKLLPQLISALDYASDSGPAILGPLVKIGKLLDSSEYQAKVIPCIVKLFASPDRQTRVRLLAQMDEYVEHLNVSVVNDQIYPHLVQGFNDNNAVIREATVKSIASLAPKLNHRNLNDDILRHFSRLQSRDDQATVRVNTTVCIGKIAPCLNPQTRQKVLAPALARGLRDPFSPARQASILALVATAQFYSIAESAGRVVPAICPLMADPDPAVRQQAFRAIRGFIDKLEKASENPAIIPDLEKHVNSSASQVSGGLSESASSWAGWAFSSMSSLVTKVQKQQQQEQHDQRKQQQQQPQQTQQKDQQQHPPVGGSSSSNLTQSPRSNEPPRRPQAASHIEPQKSQPVDDLGGWDDFDVDVEDNENGSLSNQTKKGESNRLAMSSAPANDNDDDSNWDTDNWLPLDEPAPASKPVKSAASKKSGWGDFDDDFSKGNGNSDDKFFEEAIKPDAPRSRPRQTAASGGAGAKGPLKLGAKKLT